MSPLHWIQSIANALASAAGRESIGIRRLRAVYERMLLLLSAGRGIPWTVNGETYRIDPGQRHRFGPRYDPPVADYLRGRIQPGQTCLDVGANVGVYVLQLARWSEPTGRIVAFEPNPEAVAILRRHVRMNRLTDRVRIVPSAVGNVEGEATLYAHGADGMSRLAESNPSLRDRAEPVPVPLISLDGFCAREQIEPDWLVIDVEGFEAAVLEGAADLIRRRRGRLRMLVEIHPIRWGDDGEARVALFSDLLARLGLTPRALMGQQDPLREHGSVVLE